MNAGQYDRDEIIEVEATEKNTDFTPRPIEGVLRQKAEEYLEKLKKYQPAEYEQIMKWRAERQLEVN